MESKITSVASYFEKHAPDTRLRLLECYRDEAEEFSVLSNVMITILGRFDDAHPEHTLETPYSPAYGLMVKAVNTLGAAFELTLCGYWWEPPGLMRTAIETFAVGWDIVHNPTRFTEWKNDRKFKSTISISNVGEVIPNIGRLYGLLSDLHVHTSPLNSSPFMFRGEPDPKFQLFGYVPNGKEDSQKSQIYYNLFVAFICTQITELTFVNYSQHFETIEKVPGTNEARTKVTDRHRRFADAAQIAFKEMASEPGG
tara:strand:+ start:120 stop:884 length:765 start_codon:yes stop_codon:yes gene_type:complete